MITQDQTNQIKLYFTTKPVDVVYLFGSHAHGTNNQSSDIDLAILFNSTISSSERKSLTYDYASDLYNLLHRDDLDLINLNDAPPALQFSAIEKRQIVYEKPNISRVPFESTTMSYYQDYGYYINQNTRMSLASIARS